MLDLWRRLMMMSGGEKQPQIFHPEEARSPVCTAGEFGETQARARLPPVLAMTRSKAMSYEVEDL